MGGHHEHERCNDETKIAEVACAVPSEQKEKEQRNERRKKCPRRNRPKKVEHESWRKTKKRRHEHREALVSPNRHRKKERSHHANSNNHPVKHDNRCLDRNAADLGKASEQEHTPRRLAQRVESQVAQGVENPARVPVV